MAAVMVATCQFPVSADVATNLGWIERQARHAKRQGADVAHFPEGRSLGMRASTARRSTASTGQHCGGRLSECSRSRAATRSGSFSARPIRSMTGEAPQQSLRDRPIRNADRALRQAFLLGGRSWPVGGSGPLHAGDTLQHVDHQRGQVWCAYLLRLPLSRARSALSAGGNGADLSLLPRSKCHASADRCDRAGYRHALSIAQCGTNLHIPRDHHARCDDGDGRGEPCLDQLFELLGTRVPVASLSDACRRDNRRAAPAKCSGRIGD
jgi:hypothetical protein